MSRITQRDYRQIWCPGSGASYSGFKRRRIRAVLKRLAFAYTH